MTHSAGVLAKLFLGKSRAEERAYRQQRKEILRNKRGVDLLWRRCLPGVAQVS